MTIGLFLPKINAGEVISAGYLNRVAGMAARGANRSTAVSSVDGAGGLTIGEDPPQALALVELDGDIAAHGYEAVASWLGYDGDYEGTSQQFFDSGADKRPITDTQGAVYLAGERHLVFFVRGGSRFIVPPGPVFHLGKLDGALAQGSSATVSIWEYSDGSFADSGINVTAYDWLLTGAQSLSASDKVVVWFVPHSKIWVVIAAEC